MLTPCPLCRRHVLTDSSRCPFCGSSTARAARAPVVAFGSALLIVGCGHVAPAPQEPAASIAVPATPAAPTEQIEATGDGLVERDASAPMAPDAVETPLAAASSAEPAPKATAEAPRTDAPMYGLPPHRRVAAVYGPPPPRADAGAQTPETQGAWTRDRDSIQRVFTEARSRFRLCWEQGTHGQGGRVTLKLTIARDGKVTKAEAIGSTLPVEVDRCLVAAARVLRFERAPSETSVSYPLVFEP